MGTPEDVAAEKYFEPPEDLCSECFGRTIHFWGSGKNMQYHICSRYKEPGHLTEEEINQKLHLVRMQINPSGRFA